MDKKSIQLDLIGSEALCFNKNDFMKNDFSVDSFVHIHQASGSGGLEVLRDDLGLYLKVLRSAMIDLINRDYADFVNLSTNLIGLDKFIENLKTPLGQLREEVLGIEHLLSDVINTVSNDLSRRQTINEHKAFLHRLDQISIRLSSLESLLQNANLDHCDGGDVDLVQRAAAETNHLSFLVSRCGNSDLVRSFEPRLTAVSDFVSCGLERSLAEGLHRDDHPLLRQTLRAHAALGTTERVHQQVALIIRDKLKPVINDSAVCLSSASASPLFRQCLAAVKEACGPLIPLTYGTGDVAEEVVEGYSFLEVSAWPELVSALQRCASNIFGSAKPAQFHQRYLQGMDFLDSFEALLRCERRIEALRERADFVTFLDMWHLPAYFQLRYREIGQTVELNLVSLTPFGDEKVGDEVAFFLTATVSVWRALRSCFADDVFLHPLLHRFWKLCLLLLARYRTFVRQSVANIEKNISKESTDTTSTMGRGAQSLSVRSPVGDAVALSHDAGALAHAVDHFYDKHIQPRLLQLAPQKQRVIKDTLMTQKDSLRDLAMEASSVASRAVAVESCIALRPLSDTPRLFRRTNRAAPSAPQTYVAAAIVNFGLLRKATEDVQMSTEEASKIALRAFENVVSHYCELSGAVLRSVHQTEASLRRLQRARDRGTAKGSVTPAGLSDDDKIRSQIQLDVVHFGKEMAKQGVDVDGVESYDRLLQISADAAKEASAAALS